jgi:hypothetical protein
MLKGRNCVGYLGVAGMILLKWITKNVRMSLFGWRLEQIEDFCDYGDTFSV